MLKNLWKTGLILPGFMFATLSLGADWSACAKEIKAHCKTVKGDEAIFNCLEKVDHDNKMSKECDAIHDKYEKDTGKEDKDKEPEQK